jgi:hypothetical protein
LLLGLAINLLLKAAIHDPRPYWIDTRVRLLAGPESTFGIPSGHSQNAVAIWGMLAVYLWKGWAWAAAIALILLIGFSRMYLGVHFPTDVFAGWALGIITLLLALSLEKPVLRRLMKLNEYVQVTIILAVSLAIILTGVLIITSINASWQTPVEWVQNAALQAPNFAIAPLSLDDIIVSASAFFGFIGGAIMIRSRLNFDAGGDWPHRLGRYLVGAVGVLILWQGLGYLSDLVAIDESLLGYILRFIRYTLIGVWMSALAPLVFVRLGLTSKKQLIEQEYYA